MKNTMIHQYCYWIARGLAVSAIGAGILLPALAARAGDNDAVAAGVIDATAALPASSAAGTPPTAQVAQADSTGSSPA